MRAAALICVSLVQPRFKIAKHSPAGGEVAKNHEKQKKEKQSKSKLQQNATKWEQKIGIPEKYDEPLFVQCAGQEIILIAKRITVHDS